MSGERKNVCLLEEVWRVGRIQVKQKDVILPQGKFKIHYRQKCKKLFLMTNLFLLTPTTRCRMCHLTLQLRDNLKSVTNLYHKVKQLLSFPCMCYTSKPLWKSSTIFDAHFVLRELSKIISYFVGPISLHLCTLKKLKYKFWIFSQFWITSLSTVNNNIITARFSFIMFSNPA